MLVLVSDQCGGEGTGRGGFRLATLGELEGMLGLVSRVVTPS